MGEDQPRGDRPRGDRPRAAGRLVEVLTARGRTVATAESLTGGMVCAAIVEVPGASVVLRGGVVAYADDVKASVLAVDALTLSDRGAVSAEVALAMALGVRRVLAADYGVSTTGVAGPGPSAGRPAGTVFVAVAGPHRSAVRPLRLRGDRPTVRATSTRCALDLLLTEVLGDEEAAGRQSAEHRDPAVS